MTTSNNNTQNEISAKVAHYEIFDTKIVTSTIQPTYFYINAEFYIEVSVGDAKYYANFETGSSFYHADYSLPSNQVSIEEANELLKELSELNESDFNNANIIYINDVCGTNYSQADLLAIYKSLNKVIEEAQDIVDKIATDELQEFENDKRIFVLVTHYDYIDFHNPSFGKEATSERIEVFQNTSEADGFIYRYRECELSWARIVDKAAGYKILAERE